MMPFLIHSLGDTIYGIWLIVGSLLGYYGLMDFGLNSAVQRYVSASLSTHKYDDINKTLNTVLGIFSIIGCLVLLLATLSALFVPYLVKANENIGVLRSVVIILGFSFAVGFPFRAFSGFLMADMRFDIIALIDTAKVLVRAFVIIVFISRGYGLIALAVITAVLDLISCLTQLVIVLNSYKYLRLSVSLFDTSRVRGLFGYSIHAFLIRVTNQLKFNIDNFVIAAVIGIKRVTLYSIAARLITYFMDLMDSAMGMTLPIFSQYESSGDRESIIEKFIFLTKISCYLSVFIGFFLINFGNPIIRFWIGEKYSSAYFILLILVIPFIFDVMQGPGVGLLYGISKHKYYSYINATEGVCNLCLSIVLARKYGLYGVALGTAIPMLIMKVFFQPIYICRVLKVSFAYFVKNAIGRVLIISLLVFNTYGLFVRSHNFVHLDFEFISQITIYFILALAVFFISFDKNEIAFLWQGTGFERS